jgi:hypothetical protein
MFNNLYHCVPKRLPDIRLHVITGGRAAAVGTTEETSRGCAVTTELLGNVIWGSFHSSIWIFWFRFCICGPKKRHSYKYVPSVCFDAREIKPSTTDGDGRRTLQFRYS